MRSRLRKETLLRALAEVMDSDFYSEGKMVKTLEDFIRMDYGREAIAMNSAGSGLFSLYRVLGCKHVIVPSNTFFATGAMAREAGCEVTLADCSIMDFSLSLDTLKDAYDGTQDTVVLVHVGGTIARDYLSIAQFCHENNLTLIEDAAHAFGAHQNGFKAGSLGTAAVFSFYPTKAVPVGEGGVVITKDGDLAGELRRFRNYGKQQANQRIEYATGFNFRMDEWTAAVALHQVNRTKEIMALRRADADKLRKIVKPHVDADGHNWYKYIVTEDTDFLVQAGKVYARTDQLVVSLGLPQTNPLPNSEWIADNHICLPVGEGMYEGMSLDEIESKLKRRG